MSPLKEVDVILEANRAGPAGAAHAWIGLVHNAHPPWSLVSPDGKQRP
jgi:hypothetical protein